MKKLPPPPTVDKVCFDMSLYNPLDTATFDISVNDDQLENKYIAILLQMGLLLTAGGTTLMGKGVTYADDVRPICKLVIKGEYKGVDVSTAFLVKKHNVYFEGFSFDDDGIRQNPQFTWQLLYDTTFELKNCKTKLAPFSVSYVGAHRSAKFGPYVLLNALFSLRCNDLQVKRSAFHCVCLHFAEPNRFKIISQAILPSMRQPISVITLEEKLNNLINNWEKLTSIIRGKKMDTNPDRFSLVEFAELAENGVFGDAHENLILDYISIFLMEGNIAREERRARVRALSSAASSRMVPLKGLNRKNKKWIIDVRSMTRQELFLRRRQHLERLINIGGDGDIWLCLRRALWKERVVEGDEGNVFWEPEDLHIGTLILKNTDINFPVASSDLSFCFDDKGYEYRLHLELLSDPNCRIEG